LGLTSPQTKTLVKSLSEIVVRCSYAIYLAHNSPAWSHNEDLVLLHTPPTNLAPVPTPNIVFLRKQGIHHLFHFTDLENLPSIRKIGASTLTDRSIPAKFNSDELSRKLDVNAGLQNYVRFSFSARNPMMYVSKREGRISDPVLLKIKLEAVSRPGVLFSDRNATRSDAILSESPTVVRFDVVKRDHVFEIPELLRLYYQAEVLVPSPLPPHLIIFPKIRNGSRIKNSTPPSTLLSYFIAFSFFTCRFLATFFLNSSPFSPFWSFESC